LTDVQKLDQEIGALSDTQKHARGGDSNAHWLLNQFSFVRGRVGVPSISILPSSYLAKKWFAQNKLKQKARH
jgi:hypothetical protein